MTETKKPTPKKKPASNKSKHVIVFDHARVDPSHCLTDGLFRPLKRQSLKGQSLDVRYKYKDYTFWWRNYCPLNITDQSVFLAVHRLASEKGRVTRVGATEESDLMKSVAAHMLNMALTKFQLYMKAAKASVLFIAGIAW